MEQKKAVAESRREAAEKILKTFNIPSWEAERASQQMKSEGLFKPRTDRKD
jgi:hypothetical protein